MEITFGDMAKALAQLREVRSKFGKRNQ